MNRGGVVENYCLEIEGLSKSYGRLKALDALSLKVAAGNVYGLLGPNGSGKTTTLGILLDIINKDGGEFKWFGQYSSPQVRKRIGALLEQPLFYPYLTAVQNLKIIADIRGVDYSAIEDVLKMVYLYERKSDKYRTFSLGMKQRLAIAAAMLGKPDVLILDEPTNGLDPRGIADIRSLIIQIAKSGITILLASHLLDEVEKVCTHVAVLDHGKKLFSGPVAEVLSQSVSYVVAAPDMERLWKVLSAEKWVSSLRSEEGKFVFSVSEDYSAARINRFFAEKGIFLSHLSELHLSLEKYFLELLSENHDTTH